MRERAARWRIVIRAGVLLMGVLLAATIVYEVSATFGGTATIGGNVITTSLPHPPTSVQAVTNDVPGTIDLSWTTTTDPSASGYHILRGATTGGPYIQIADVPGKSSASYQDTGLAESQTYFYVVRTYLYNWESVDSAEASAAGGPALGMAARFSVLAGAGVTNAGATTINGDLGVSPSTTIADNGVITLTGSLHLNDEIAIQGQADLATEYNTLVGSACTATLSGQDLGGMTLTPSVYCFGSSAQLTGALTLDAQNNPNAVFVFKIGSTLTTAVASSVTVINGSVECNAYWLIGSSATIGVNTTFAGSVLAVTSITLNAGASISGRALAQGGSVTMDNNALSTIDRTC